MFYLLETLWSTIKDILSSVQGILVAITPLGIAWIAYKQSKIGKKVDNYHKEVNGKMGELLDTTKKLGNAEGRADLKEEQKLK